MIISILIVLLTVNAYASNDNSCNRLQARTPYIPRAVFEPIIKPLAWLKLNVDINTILLPKTWERLKEIKALDDSTTDADKTEMYEEALLGDRIFSAAVYSQHASKAPGGERQFIQPLANDLLRNQDPAAEVEIVSKALIQLTVSYDFAHTGAIDRLNAIFESDPRVKAQNQIIRSNGAGNSLAVDVIHNASDFKGNIPIEKTVEAFLENTPK